MNDEFPSAELPLIISYEAKSMGDNLEVIRSRLVERGYINSFGNTNDGFSLLKAEVILQTLNRKGGIEGGRSKKSKGAGASKQRPVDDGPGLDKSAAVFTDMETEKKMRGKRGKGKGKSRKGGGGGGGGGEGRKKKMRVEEEI
jgi:hypothetical protein